LFYSGKKRLTHRFPQPALAFCRKHPIEEFVFCLEEERIPRWGFFLATGSFPNWRFTQPRESVMLAALDRLRHRIAAVVTVNRNRELPRRSGLPAMSLGKETGSWWVGQLFAIKAT